MKSQQIKTKQIAVMGLFIAMCVVGGYIKIPNPVTDSIAFDSLPAFLGALILGGIPGAILGFLGHMISAAIGGFPLTLPIHIFIALEMAVIMYIFSFVTKKINIFVGVIIAIILNGIISPALFIPLPGYGIAFFTGSVIFLTVATVLNVVIASIIFQSLKKSKFIRNNKIN
jgi:Protein of unknown function (DUF1393).